MGDLVWRVEEARLATGAQTPTADGASELQRREKELKTAKDEYLAVLKEIEADFSRPPDAEKDKEPRIEETRELQATLLKFGSKAVAVYTLTATDKFRAIVVTPDEMLAVSSPVAGADLNYKAQQLWALLQTDEYDPQPLSREIYDVVFRPIRDRLVEEKKLEEVLPEGATVMWSLDGNRAYLPMNALYDGEKYLVERYNNIVFTRADTERWTRNVSQTWTGVGFGNSRGGSVIHLGWCIPSMNCRTSLKN